VKFKSTRQTITQCKRCATCCNKGGPALHFEDAHLVVNGKILLRNLYTIRPGEPDFDNIQNRIRPADSDIIKIKSKKNSQTCVFLNESNHDCTIYAQRPVECRALKCWDTQQIERIYCINRLTRKDLLSDSKDLWNLICDHQTRCDYSKIQKILTFLSNRSDERRLKELHRMIRYDQHLRSVLAEKGGMDRELMDFLFGLPLSQTIKRFAHQAVRQLLI